MPEENSSKETQQQDKKQLINKLLINTTNIHLIRSFSFPLEKTEVLSKFCEIARREAGSRGFSEIAVKAIEEYVKNHEEGNPQLKLTTYIDDKTQSPVSVLCLFLDGAASNGEIHCRKAGMWIKGIRCYPCKNNRLRKTTRSQQE
ncbi:MAG: hypothetical protein NWE94_04610 [Candidatus Bathyarchaeota archaeon]|nr:hypothetical protein [Candidatus Bathyarchaeota archaeon]